ncbi:MAG TPA: sulfatase [Verrucomicrobiales bacterium]|nr:sulfatase [Verrucomicrobiales bacterium]
MKFLIFLLFPVTILAEKKRPNIVFFFTDDHAPHAIGAYNGWLKSVNPTPEIDKLADDGMLFENSFCTNSICGPSRAVIMSGKHSHKNGFMNNGNSFDWNQQIFPKILRAAGYHTALYGKSHLKGKPQGFDSWAVLPGQGDYYNPAMLTPKGRKIINGYCTDIVTDMAIDFIKESKELGKPFMLMCQHKAPHRTWMPALRHLHLYDDIDIPEPKTLFDQYEGRIPAQHQEMEIDRHMYLDHDLFTDLTPDLDFPKQRRPSEDRSAYINMKRMTPDQLKTWRAAYDPKDKAFREAKLTGRDLVRWKFQRYAKNYLRAIKGVDENLARLRKALEDQDLADNTVFVYSSDQGFYIGDHGWYDKRWMYEESLKMPLIISWPGVIKPGSRNTDLVQNLDYAQTFLEMAGAETPSDMQGASLMPLLKGNRPDDWRKSIYYHYYEYPSYHQVPRHNGIRTERYKLINFYEFGEWEFYDLKTDPDELKNLYGNPEKKELINDVRKQLLKLQKGYGDDTVLKEKPQEWKRKMRNTTSVKTKANFRPRVK